MDFVDNRPIGVFDSGIGGLTVLRELVALFPYEDFIYLGDTARLPYGSKSEDTIRAYTLQNLEYLTKWDIKCAVIACNSASSQFPEIEFKGRPVYTVIEPGAAMAIERSKSKRVGILGTRATVQSKAYELAIKKVEPLSFTTAQPCPLFVPFAEEGLDGDPLTNLLAYRYIHPILAHNIDTLILGCTHYPLLENSIARAAGQTVELINSGIALAEKMKRDLKSGLWNQKQRPAEHNSSPYSTRIRVLTTDGGSHFQTLAEKIMKPNLIESFRVVHVLE